MKNYCAIRRIGSGNYKPLNKMDHNGRILYETDFHTRDYQTRLPWHPFTSTNTWFSEDHVSPRPTGGIDLIVSPSRKCFNDPRIGTNGYLGYEGGLITWVNKKQTEAMEFKEAVFSFKMMPPAMGMAYTGAFWLLRRAELLTHPIVIGSKTWKETIMPEYDWPEFGVPDNPLLGANAARHSGLIYEDGYHKQQNFNVPRIHGLMNYWLVLGRRWVELGFEGETVGRFRRLEPDTYFYPIFSLAASKWSSPMGGSSMFIDNLQIREL